MTLIIQKPTGAKLNLAQTYVGIDDPDAAVYVAAVEAADGQSLETATKVAIHSFVKGCKADGIWPAIKASCILAGAHTLTGALVPLVGAAPTNSNFVSGDYDRKTGLLGDGSTKRLNTNRDRGSDPSTNNHLAVYASTVASSGSYIGASGKQMLANSSTQIGLRIYDTTTTNVNSGNGAFMGITRRSDTSSSYRLNGVAADRSASVATLTNVDQFVFCATASTNFSSSRLAFYSVGETIDLAKLDTRVSALITAIGAAF